MGYYNESERERQHADALTSHELVLLQLLARGYSRQRIAALTTLSQLEIAALERSACLKLGAVDLDDAVAKARRRRLIL